MLAETDERRIRAFEFRLAAGNPEFMPLLLKLVYVETRRDDSCFVVCLRIEYRKHRFLGGGEGLHRIPIGKTNVVAIQSYRIIWHMVVLRIFMADSAYQPPKLLLA